MTPRPAAVPTAVRPWSPAVLCAALEAANVTLTSSRDGLVASPRSGVTGEMADGIRQYKASLKRALFGMGPVTPFVCGFCQLDFVSIRGQRCTTCVQLIGQPFRFAPGSSEESQFLHVLAKRDTSQNDCDQLSQGKKWESSGTVANLNRPDSPKIQTA